MSDLEPATKKRKCTFTDNLKQKFPGFERGRHESEVKCGICDCFINIGNKGAGDLQKHTDTSKHQSSIRTHSSTNKIERFFPQKFDPLFKKVQAAEATLAYHTVNHHQSFKSVDCMSKLGSIVYPDSTISKNIRCGKTKTEAIITNVIGPYSLQLLLDTLRNKVSFYSVGTDASNHGALKLFPVVVQYFDPDRGIEVQLLELETCTNEKAVTISNYIYDTLKKNDIESKCIAFSSDNTNTNFGGCEHKVHKEGNNVFTLLKSKMNNNLIAVGCSAHILHNTVQHGTDILPIDIESIVMKIYNFFHVYTVRTETLGKFCDQAEMQRHELLKHSKTRWLSLYPAIEKILKVYPALQKYFTSQPKVPTLLKNFSTIISQRRIFGLSTRPCTYSIQKYPKSKGRKTALLKYASSLIQ